eukprot:67146_1
MPIDAISHCISFLDTKSYHNMLVVSKIFNRIGGKGIAYHNVSTEFTTAFWNNLFALPNSNWMTQIDNMLNKYKFTKQLVVFPIKQIGNQIYIEYVYDLYRAFDVTESTKYKISYTFNFVAENYTKLTWLTIFDYFHCSNLFPFICLHNQPSITLHIQAVLYNYEDDTMDYCANQWIKMVTRCNVNVKISHIIYENFFDMTDEMISISVKGLKKLSLIRCNSVYSGKKLSSISNGIVGLQITPARCLWTLQYVLELCHNTKYFTLSADDYDTGDYINTYKGLISGLHLRNMETLTLILDDHSFRQEDFWTLIFNLQMPNLKEISLVTMFKDDSKQCMEYLTNKIRLFVSYNKRSVTTNIVHYISKQSALEFDKYLLDIKFRTTTHSEENKFITIDPWMENKIWFGREIELSLTDSIK